MKTKRKKTIVIAAITIGIILTALCIIFIFLKKKDSTDDNVNPELSLYRELLEQEEYEWNSDIYAARDELSFNIADLDNDGCYELLLKYDAAPAYYGTQKIVCYNDGNAAEVWGEGNNCVYIDEYCPEKGVIKVSGGRMGSLYAAACTSER